MDVNVLDSAIATAKSAAERARDFKAETYGAVLLFELMRSAAPARYRNQLPLTAATHGPTREKPYSAAELFAKKLWSTEIDKVAIAGFFLERFGGSASYTVEDLRNCLVAAKVPLPKNTNLAITQAVQKGLMMEIPSQSASRKSWALTQTGELYVENMTAQSKASHA